MTETRQIFDDIILNYGYVKTEMDICASYVHDEFESRERASLLVPKGTVFEEELAGRCPRKHRGTRAHASARWPERISQKLISSLTTQSVLQDDGRISTIVRQLWEQRNGAAGEIYDKDFLSICDVIGLRPSKTSMWLQDGSTMLPAIGNATRMIRIVIDEYYEVADVADWWKEDETYSGSVSTVATDTVIIIMIAEESKNVDYEDFPATRSIYAAKGVKKDSTKTKDAETKPEKKADGSGKTPAELRRVQKFIKELDAKEAQDRENLVPTTAPEGNSFPEVDLRVDNPERALDMPRDVAIRNPEMSREEFRLGIGPKPAHVNAAIRGHYYGRRWRSYTGTWRIRASQRCTGCSRAPGRETKRWKLSIIFGAVYATSW